MEKLYGIIGEKLPHTYSPEIHHKIFEAIGVEGHFGIFEVQKDNLCNVISGIKALNIQGITVTIPYKVDIIQYLDEVSEEVKSIGAANVIHIDEHRAIGYNTDYHGFGMTLDKFNIDIKNKGILVLGTGGASRAVVQHLVDNGAKEVVLASTDVEGGRQKYPQYKVISYEELNSMKDSSLIVNCTPVGMYPKCNDTPIDRKYLSNFQAAVDIIYNPTKTQFLKDAEEQGLNTVNGMYMLVAQAVKAQELWNNMKISTEVVDKIYEYMNKRISE